MMRFPTKLPPPRHDPAKARLLRAVLGILLLIIIFGACGIEAALKF